MNLFKKQNSNLKTAINHGDYLQEYCLNIIYSILSTERLRQLGLGSQFFDSLKNYSKNQQTVWKIVNNDLRDIGESNAPVNYVIDAVTEENIKNELFTIIGVDVLKLYLSQKIDRSDGEKVVQNQVWELSITIVDEMDNIIRLDVTPDTISNALRLNDFYQIGAVKLHEMETLDPRAEDIEHHFKPLNEGMQKNIYDLTGKLYDYHHLFMDTMHSEQI
ncbi:hypothetical protein [Weissella minor]|uniref:hypothetical protein n=1 Tax=Weissella minor TaxID=1620 RepID=UPI003AF23363